MPIRSIEVIPMIKEANAMKVRKNLGELLNEIQYRGDSFLVTRSGKPVAAMIDIKLFNKIKLFETEFDRMIEDLQSHFSSVPSDEIEEDLDEAIRAIRNQ
jgi:prevent-host-death family protein